MDKRWWKEAVFYQIYPRSFNDSNGDGIGDLRGIRQRIDYLDYLGIDAVWLCPVYDSPNDDNGYDVRHYREIMGQYGDMEDWKRLTEDLHERDIKLIMDFVPNHTSDEHLWFRKSRKSKDNEYRDYYIWREGKAEKPPNNWKSVFGGSAWEYDNETEEYYLHLFSKKQPDLNWDNPEVREELYETMRWWLEKGVDGFRLDVVNFVSKNYDLPDDDPQEAPGSPGSSYYIDGPDVHSYLQEMNRKVFSDSGAVAIGETPMVSKEDGVKYVDPSRDELDLIFQFDHVTFDQSDGGFWDLPREWKLTELKEIMTGWREAVSDVGGWNAIYLGNHDQPRIVSRFGNDDEYRRESAQTLATLQLTISGTPFIYQGEEIGMTNYPFSSLEELRDVQSINQFNEMKNRGEVEGFDEVRDYVRFWSRDNARTPMQWDAGENAGFTEGEPWINVNPNKDQINVKDERASKSSVLNYYKKLISLRKDYEALIYGDYRLVLEDDEDIFAFLREGSDNSTLTVLNFSETGTDVGLAEGANCEKGELLISNYPEAESGELNSLALRPYEARVYKI